MSISTIITEGYGSFGSVNSVILNGYSAAPLIPPTLNGIKELILDGRITKFLLIKGVN